MTTETLIRNFERANREMIETIQSMSDEQWHATCAAEGWSVGVTAHHLASSLEAARNIVPEIMAGTGPAITVEFLDERNARHAVEYADVTRETTLAKLRHEHERVVEWLSQLTPEDLERTTTLPYTGDDPITAYALIDGFIVRHIHAHLSSIHAAIGEPAATER